MPIYLRYNTASQEIPLGYFVDSTDGNTAETALSIANTDIQLWKTGASTLANKNSGGATHISGGIYYCTLDATDTNTVGSMVVYCHVSGALSTRTECVVLPAQVYDSLIAGSDLLDCNASQLGGTSQTGRDIGTSVLLSSGTGTGQISLSSGLVTLAGVTHTGAVIPTVTTLTGHTAQTGDCYARLGAPAGASMSADIAAIQADTDNIQTRLPTVLVSGTADSGSTTTLVDAARTESTTDHWRGQALVITSGTNSGLGRLITGFTPGTDTITVSPAFPAAISTDTYEIWPASDAILAQLTHTSAVIPTVTTLTGHTAQTGDTYARLGAPSGASISADIAAAKSDTAAILDDTGTSGVVVASGSKTGYSLIATTGLGNQTANITGSLSGSVGSVTGAVGSVTGNVGGNVTGSIGSLATQAKADVNAEVVDTLNTDTYAEPGQEAPGATVSLAKKIGYLYKAFRNKITQTSTTLSIYDDAGTTVDQKATVSDDTTTYTRGEIGTGP